MGDPVFGELLISRVLHSKLLCRGAFRDFGAFGPDSTILLGRPYQCRAKVSRFFGTAGTAGMSRLADLAPLAHHRCASSPRPNQTTLSLLSLFLPSRAGIARSRLDRFIPHAHIIQHLLFRRSCRGDNTMDDLLRPTSAGSNPSLDALDLFGGGSEAVAGAVLGDAGTAGVSCSISWLGCPRNSSSPDPPSFSVLPSFRPSVHAP